MPPLWLEVWVKLKSLSLAVSHLPLPPVLLSLVGSCWGGERSASVYSPFTLVDWTWTDPKKVENNWLDSRWGLTAVLSFLPFAVCEQSRMDREKKKGAKLLPGLLLPLLLFSLCNPFLATIHSTASCSSRFFLPSPVSLIFCIYSGFILLPFASSDPLVTA